MASQAVAAQVSWIPTGFHTITPFLLVDGAYKVIDFVKETFGAEEIVRSMRPDGLMGHAQLRIGNSFLMLGDVDPTEPWKPMPSVVSVYVEDCEKTYERSLQAGALSLIKPRNWLHGDRGAGVQDPAGNLWWIATHFEDVSPEEILRRAQIYFESGREVFNMPSSQAAAAQVSWIPTGFHTITPFLLVDAAYKVIDFVKETFDAEEIVRSMRPDGLMGHAQLRVGNSFLMLGDADPTEPWKPMPSVVSVYVEDCEKTYERSLRAGGLSVIKPRNWLQGDRGAGVQDPAGNLWWIATHFEQGVSPER